MKKSLFTVVILASIISCSKDESPIATNLITNTISLTTQSSCDASAEINPTLYNSISTDHVVINSLKIENNCLTINYSASGCDGNSWEIQLIDAGVILESYPPQRNLKISLKNEELCDAIITKETSFDISNLIVDSGKTYLNISGQSILYE